MELIAHRLTGEPHELEALQKLAEDSREYFLRISGAPADDQAALDILHSLPPGKELRNKTVLGFYLDKKLIGCADLIRGFPDLHTVMLGLLLVDPQYLRQGWGSKAHELVEKQVSHWLEIKKLRIGVVKTNGDVLHFWQKMGYLQTGTKPYVSGNIHSETIILEKKLT